MTNVDDYSTVGTRQQDIFPRKRHRVAPEMYPEGSWLFDVIASRLAKVAGDPDGMRRVKLQQLRRRLRGWRVELRCCARGGRVARVSAFDGLK